MSLPTVRPLVHIDYQAWGELLQDLIRYATNPHNDTDLRIVAATVIWPHLRIRREDIEDNAVSEETEDESSES